jgi:hypothetical protein
MEKKEVLIMVLGIAVSLIVFAVTIYLRSGAF